MFKLFHKLKIILHNLYYYKTPPVNGISYINTKKVLNYKNFYFNCTLCGKCCYGPGNVYFTEKNLIDIKKFLKLDIAKWKHLIKILNLKKRNQIYIYQPSKQCMFLDNHHRCTIYPVRPLQCRSFPFWPSIFSSKNALSGLIKSCPGSSIQDFFDKNNSISSSEIVFYCNQTIKKFHSYQKTTNGNWIQL